MLYYKVNILGVVWLVGPGEATDRAGVVQVYHQRQVDGGGSVDGRGNVDGSPPPG